MERLQLNALAFDRSLKVARTNASIPIGVIQFRFNNTSGLTHVLGFAGGFMQQSICPRKSVDFQFTPGQIPTE